MKTGTTRMTPEMETIKTKLRATWMAGDFGQIARTFAAGAEDFVARLALKPGERVLDIACGTGNQSLPAARTGAVVTGVDLAPNLIEQAKANAASAGLKIQFDEGDAEELPYDDSYFDAVMTMFGAMFAPRPEVTAAEMLRVCRPGGRIVMANWTPEGFIGQMFKTTAKHVPPANFPSPILWGKDEVVRERLSNGVSDLKFNRVLATLVLPMTPNESVEFFRQFYGPTQRAFAALDETAQQALRADLEALWSACNLATDGTTRVESEYLEVVAIRSRS